jgi:hypothetical protein
MHGGALLGATLLILASAVIAAKSSAGPAPSSSASAAPAPPPKERDPVPLASVVFPTEKSPTPKLDEWSSAPLVALSENSEKARCHARVVREWLKIHCDGPWGMIRELAGSPADVVFWIAPRTPTSSLGDGAEIVVAVRKGDRRLIQFFGIMEGYEGPAWPTVAGFVEEQWDEGDDHPTVVLR